MPYKAGDRVAEVSLDCLQVCAGRGKNHFATLTKDVTIHAKQFVWGFTVYLRVDFKPKTLIFKVHTGTQKTRREYLSLQCPLCRVFSRWMYLDWDSLTGICKKCYRLPKTYTHPRPSRWVDTDFLRFQKLFKKRIAVTVSAATFKSLRSMKAPEFFAAHPYLVPPFFETIARYDQRLYEKSLRHLLGIYKRRIYLWKAPKLSQEENDWLDRHLAEKLSREYGILKGESEWLKANLEPLKPHAGESSSLCSKEGNGNLSGILLAPSKSPDMATVSSSSKTNSSPATSAAPAMEPERFSAPTAMETDATASTRNSGASPARELPDKPPAPSATAREDCLLSRNSPSDARLPDESSQLAAR